VQGCNLLIAERREKARERQKQVKKKDGSAVEVKEQLITKQQRKHRKVMRRWRLQRREQRKDKRETTSGSRMKEEKLANNNYDNLGWYIGTSSTSNINTHAGTQEQNSLTHSLSLSHTHVHTQFDFPTPITSKKWFWGICFELTCNEFFEKVGKTFSFSKNFFQTTSWYKSEKDCWEFWDVIWTAKPQFLFVVLFCRYLFGVGIWVKEKERWLWRV